MHVNLNSISGVRISSSTSYPTYPNDTMREVAASSHDIVLADVGKNRVDNDRATF